MLAVENFMVWELTKLSHMGGCGPRIRNELLRHGSKSRNVDWVAYGKLDSRALRCAGMTVYFGNAGDADLRF